jgi:hypothetical protein
LLWREKLWAEEEIRPMWKKMYELSVIGAVALHNVYHHYCRPLDMLSS